MKINNEENKLLSSDEDENEQRFLFQGIKKKKQIKIENLFQMLLNQNLYTEIKENYLKKWRVI